MLRAVARRARVDVARGVAVLPRYGRARARAFYRRFAAAGQAARPLALAASGWAWLEAGFGQLWPYRAFQRRLDRTRATAAPAAGLAGSVPRPLAVVGRRPLGMVAICRLPDRDGAVRG